MIMSTFGSLSKGERNRIKVRVRAAMSAQAQMEGRYLGGRPPYGYRLIDGGPHNNPAKAADGKRLHILAIDEEAAAVVERSGSPACSIRRWPGAPGRSEKQRRRPSARTTCGTPTRPSC